VEQHDGHDVDRFLGVLQVLPAPGVHSRVVEPCGDELYIPDSLPKEGLREAAISKMDETLTKLQHAADKVMDGDGVVELTTNSTKAAEFIEARMKVLGIRGYVRIVPE
jgi:hypothetical protein